MGVYTVRAEYKAPATHQRLRDFLERQERYSILPCDIRVPPNLGKITKGSPVPSNRSISCLYSILDATRIILVECIYLLPLVWFGETRETGYCVPMRLTGRRMNPFRRWIVKSRFLKPLKRSVANSPFFYLFSLAIWRMNPKSTAGNTRSTRTEDAYFDYRIFLRYTLFA